MALAPLPFDDLDAIKFRDESQTIAALLADPPLGGEARAAVHAEAVRLVEAARQNANRQGVVESFLQEFSLGTREGLALMCLAEALLRTPDEDTRDRLIAEKIGSADWASHLGQSDSLFVNASTWGLMLTGKLVDVDDDARRDLPGFLARVAGRIGEQVQIAQRLGGEERDRRAPRLRAAAARCGHGCGDDDAEAQRRSRRTQPMATCPRHAERRAAAAPSPRR